MAKFKTYIDYRETNRYEFVVEAETQEEAAVKLINYCAKNSPSFGHQTKEGVTCIDCESSMDSTSELQKIYGMAPIQKVPQTPQ